MFNLSTLSGINLQTDNYFQYTSHVFVLQIKRLCVQSQTHLCLNSNALAFQVKRTCVSSKRTCVFYTYLIKHKKRGIHHPVHPSFYLIKAIFKSGILTGYRQRLPNRLHLLRSDPWRASTSSCLDHIPNLLPEKYGLSRARQIHRHYR